MHSADPVELRPSQFSLRAALRVISRQYTYIYSHATTPLGQLERAYYLSYFINNRCVLLRFQVIIGTVMQIGPAMGTYGAIMFVSV